MKNRFLIVSIACILLLPAMNSCRTKDASNADKPNLIFIWTDEQQPFTMSVYGNDRIKTPNLNKLADESVVFKHAYVTQPVCTPSRSSTMTGLWPHTSGCVSNNIPLPENVPCLPELINDTDYRTAYFGKWHLGDEIYAQHGFEEWEAIEDSYIKYYSESRDKADRSGYHHWLVEKGYEPDDDSKFGKKFSRSYAASLPLEHGKPKFLEEKSIDFIRRNKDNPFILCINYLEPHMPFTGPLDQLHSPEDVYLPESFGHQLDHQFPERYRKKQASVKKKYGESEEEIRQLIARYWGLVSLVDMSVGNILNELEKLGLDENTIVVYTSDHGDMMGAHSLAEKGLIFEESVKVPLLIRYPKMFKDSRIIESRVSLIDVLPTVMDLMEKDEVTGLQGKSLVPYINGASLEENYVFSEWNNESYSSRTVISPDGLKLCIEANDKDVLFDLNKDPHEMINLIDDPAYQDNVIRLTDIVLEWQKKTGDTLILNP